MAKHPGGRPIKHDPDVILQTLEQYIADTDHPLIAGYCVKQGISSSRFYAIAETNKEIQDAIKKATDKMEAYLIENGTQRKIDSGFGIFLLKQQRHGYSDKQQFDLSAQINISFSDEPGSSK
jgi:DNA-directed RNA polymerase subunit L